MSDLMMAMAATTSGDPRIEAAASLLVRLNGYQMANEMKESYYNGSQIVKDLGISVPPQLQLLQNVVGWPGIGIDVLEERIDWQGWVAPGGDDFGLSDVFKANNLATESSLTHLDSMIYGVSFVCVGDSTTSAGSQITIESPRSMTVTWDARLRQVSSALRSIYDERGRVIAAVMFLPNETVQLSLYSGAWTIDDIETHNLGRVPVIRFPNRPWGANRMGRSEITRAIRSLTNQAVRTLIGAEIAREFYSSPQRWMMGADEDMFVDASGNPVSPWESYLGRILAIGRDEDGNVPEVGQFPAASTGPYLDHVKMLAQMFAAEAAIPATYLGFETTNPASADAITASEVRLLKRADRRCGQLGIGWMQTAEMVLLRMYGEVPDGFDDVSLAWRDPSTPTTAASADAAVKLIQAGVLLPDSSVTYDMIGLSPWEQVRLNADRRRSGASSLIQMLSDAAAGFGPQAKAPIPQPPPTAAIDATSIIDDQSL